MSGIVKLGGRDVTKHTRQHLGQLSSEPRRARRLPLTLHPCALFPDLALDGALSLFQWLSGAHVYNAEDENISSEHNIVLPNQRTSEEETATKSGSSKRRLFLFT